MLKKPSKLFNQQREKLTSELDLVQKKSSDLQVELEEKLGTIKLLEEQLEVG
jgi:hypothetical protein